MTDRACTGCALVACESGCIMPHDCLVHAREVDTITDIDNGCVTEVRVCRLCGVRLIVDIEPSHQCSASRVVVNYVYNHLYATWLDVFECSVCGDRWTSEPWKKTHDCVDHAVRQSTVVDTEDGGEYGLYECGQCKSRWVE